MAHEQVELSLDATPVAPSYPVVPDGAFRCAAAPTLPFFAWHEHATLRPIGSTTLALPFSPFYALFLETGASAAGRDPRRFKMRS
mmetsp:Transcript_23751/g.74218  ORF Transcript_23751/g.74218 Transcript_23751/m.74218 type:complete len:85 (-) Transcript_23751:45-299(-)